MVAEAHPDAGDPLVALLRRSRPEEGLVTENAIAQASAHLHQVMRSGAEPSPNGHPSLADRYVLVRSLGVGATGWVYEAYDPELERAVAVKLVRDDTPFGSEGESRLFQEARTLAQFNHPNVIAVHDVGIYERLAGLGSAGHGVFLVMELVRGDTLRDRFERSRPGWREALELLLPAADGLVAAHRAGVVHGDFKPENVLVAQDGRVLLVDFGLGRATGADDESEEGAIVGSPAFMAPELHAGRPSSPASDQFAFCVSLFEAIHGKRPFRGSTREQLRAAAEAGPISGPVRVPPWLDRALRRGLQPDPGRRFESMAELVRELRGRMSLRKRGIAGVGFAAVGLAAGLAVALPNATRDTCAPQAEELDGVWDARTRERIQEQFLASELPFAEQTVKTVERQLDAYVAQWMELRQDVCEVDDSAQQRAVRTCLEGRRSGLAHATRILVQADPTLVTHATEIIAELPPVSACMDATPSLEEPAVAKGVEIAPLEADLARASALITSGQFAQAGPLVDDVVRRAEQTGAPAMLAEALLQRGQLQTDQGRWKEAESSLYQALTAAERVGDAKRAIEAQLGLVEALRKRNKPEESKRILELVRARMELQNLGPALAAKLAEAEALVAFQRGHIEQARDHSQEALRLAEAAYGPNSAQAVMSLYNLAVMQARLFDIEAAEATYASLRRRMEEGLGKHHPLYGLALMGLGFVHLDTARTEKAQEYLHAALEVIEPVLGVAHEYASWIHLGLGMAAGTLNDPETSLEHLNKAVEISRVGLGPNHPETGSALATVCVSMGQQGRLAEVVDTCREARDVMVASWGTEHPRSARAISGYGAALVETGELDKGLNLLQEAYAIRLRTVPADHPHVGYSHLSLGKAYLAKGDPVQASEHLYAALDVWSTSYGPDHPENARALMVLARASVQNEDLSGALQQAERAVKLLEAKGKSPKKLADARALLAELIERQGSARRRGPSRSTARAVPVDATDPAED